VCLLACGSAVKVHGAALLVLLGQVRMLHVCYICFTAMAHLFVAAGVLHV
jgi:hypothetical protein